MNSRRPNQTRDLTKTLEMIARSPADALYDRSPDHFLSNPWCALDLANLEREPAADVMGAAENCVSSEEAMTMKCHTFHAELDEVDADVVAATSIAHLAATVPTLQRRTR